MVEPVAISVFKFLVLEFLLFRDLDEDSIALFWNIFAKPVAMLIGAEVLGSEKLLINGSQRMDPMVSIWRSSCKDFFKDKILQPLWDRIAGTVEKMQERVGILRDRWDTGMVNFREERSGDVAGDEEVGEAASRAESNDAREATLSAALRLDSRRPASIFDDVSVVSDASEVDVDYVGSYVSLRRSMLGWVAVVFCTAVLGYDKGVVIK